MSEWPDAAVRCRCGAAVTEWHSRAETRRLRRLYGDADGCVPACPACTTGRGNERELLTVPHAVRLRFSPTRGVSR